LSEIENSLETLTHFATITKEENKILDTAGLKKEMPKDYYDPKSPLYNDVFARYKKVGIEVRRV